MRPPSRVSVWAWPWIGLIRLYQVTLSPFIGGHCRFQPTCSRYGEEALRTHGALRGLWLTARRVGRCHPLGGKGWDPVPPADQPPSEGPPSEGPPSEGPPASRTGPERVSAGNLGDSGKDRPGGTG